MRIFVAAVGCIALSVAMVPALASAPQEVRNSILQKEPPARIAQWRALCPSGTAGSSVKRLKDAGFQTLSTGGWCVTILTRAGRDGTLGYVRDTRNTQLTAANAFDSGFVGGYLKHEALPSDAPSVAALLPAADRCLELRETNTKLCSSVGYILGVRAAAGELVPVA